MDFSKFKDLPVSFTVNKQYDTKDTRFLDITIDVLHTGQNFNGSIFNKEIVDKNIDSIKNTPILGYIQLNDDGSVDDFKAHEYKVVKKNDKYQYVYAGYAYGTIPESCNPRWINKVSSDGVMREYLQVDALIWTKFDKAVDIFNRDIIKGQSMELAEDSMQGTEDAYGIFTFTEFKFDGCCILSTTDPRIQPAMIDSVVVTNFSTENIFAEIKTKLDEYYRTVKFEDNKTFSQENKKEEKILNEDKIESVVEEVVTEVVTEIPTEAIVEPMVEDVAQTEPAEFTETVVEPVIDYKAEYEKINADFSALQTEFSTYKETYKTAESDVETLRTYQAEKLATERIESEDAIFAQFTELNDNKDFKVLKENAKNYDLEVLTDKCFSIKGRLNSNFSLKRLTPKSTVKIAVDTTSNKTDPYGGLFETYGNKEN